MAAKGRNRKMNKRIGKRAIGRRNHNKGKRGEKKKDSARNYTPVK